ncbi:Band 7 protein, partial [Daphnia magna]
MFALELASAPVNSSFSDRFGGGGNGDEPASSIPPEFRSKYGTSFADYPQPLSDPVRTRIWADPGGPGICAFILTLFSFLLILATFPLSLCFSVKV